MNICYLIIKIEQRYQFKHIFKLRIPKAFHRLDRILKPLTDANIITASTTSALFVSNMANSLRVSTKSRQMILMFLTTRRDSPIKHFSCLMQNGRTSGTGSSHLLARKWWRHSEMAKLWSWTSCRYFDRKSVMKLTTLKRQESRKRPPSMRQK